MSENYNLNLNREEALRLKAVEIALQQYENSAIKTETLLNDAAKIAKFIKDGNISDIS